VKIVFGAHCAKNASIHVEPKPERPLFHAARFA